jgi:anthranilate phosphoribosyltransferase
VIQSYLKLIGNGQKSARTLSEAEAQTVMEQIASGAATPTQIGALMAILRFKEETVDEMIGFTKALRQAVERIDMGLPHLVDIGIPYDGRTKFPQLLVASACIAAACDVRVAMHGRQGQTTSPKFGVGVGDTLEALEISPFLPLSSAAHLLEEVGIAYVDSSKYAPTLEAFNSLRVEYGMRSFFNTIEKLLNPFHAPTLMLGVFHGAFLRRLPAVVQGLDYERGIVVQGTEGAVDVLSSRRTPLIEFFNGTTQEWQVDPNDFGDWQKQEETTTPFTATISAELTQQILDPQSQSDAFQRGSVLTAALLIYMGGKASTFQEAVALAENSLSSGLAQARLLSLQEISSKLSH